MSYHVVVLQCKDKYVYSFFSSLHSLDFLEESAGETNMDRMRKIYVLKIVKKYVLRDP